MYLQFSNVCSDMFNLAIITLAKRLIHLYNKANKEFLSSVIDILIFLYIISVSYKNMLH